MAMNGEADQPPLKFGVAVVDLMTGMYAAQAVLAALYEREKTGRGRHIEMALFDCGLMVTAYYGLEALLLGPDPPRYGNSHPSIVPYGVFDAADGPLVITVGNNAQFRRFCDEVHRAPRPRQRRALRRQPGPLGASRRCCCPSCIARSPPHPQGPARASRTRRHSVRRGARAARGADLAARHGAAASSPSSRTRWRAPRTCWRRRTASTASACRCATCRRSSVRTPRPCWPSCLGTQRRGRRPARREVRQPRVGRRYPCGRPVSRSPLVGRPLGRLNSPVGERWSVPGNAAGRRRGIDRPICRARASSRGRARRRGRGRRSA